MHGSKVEQETEGDSNVPKGLRDAGSPPYAMVDFAWVKLMISRWGLGLSPQIWSILIEFQAPIAPPSHSAVVIGWEL